jgi:two-component system, LytTR family, sensor kinase
MTQASLSRPTFAAPSNRWSVDGMRSRFNGDLLLLTAAVWLGSFLLSTIRDLAAPPPDFAQMTAIRLAFAVLGGVLCMPIELWLNALAKRPFHQQILATLPVVAVAAIIFTEGTRHAQGVEAGATWRFYNTIYWAIFFLVWVALRLALTYSHEAVAQSERARDMEADAHDAQMRALRYQVDPHFLFNALNSISALVVVGRNEDAEAMIAKLSRFFRATTEIDPYASITLDQELALQRTYLEIEQVRFPDLAVAISVAPEAATAAVPSLILQPLIENAIRHGVARSPVAASIAIEASTSNGVLTITIANSVGYGVASTGTETGLANVSARLAAAYGAKAALRTELRGKMFIAQLTLPCA